MIIKRIKLHNYRQHGDLDVNIEGSVIAVVGSNGSGKSNFLGAIQFAFTGEQAGFKKTDLLMWGANEGYVLVEFEHGGVEARLSRSLHNAGATLHWGDAEYKGATSVAEALRVHLGLDKDLVKQAVFVRQAEIDAILFTDPAVRERSFQKLMGIGDATKIHKNLGDAIASIDLPASYDEQIADGKARWAEMHGRLQGLKVQLDAMKTQRAQAPSIDMIKQTITSHHAKLQALTRHNMARMGLLEQQNAAWKAQQAYDALPSADGMQSLPEVEKAMNDLGLRMQDVIAYQNAKAEWQKCGEAVLALGAEPHAPATLQKLRTEYNETMYQLNQLYGQHKLHADLAKALGGSTAAVTECPVCGAPVTDATALASRLSGILGRITAESTAVATKAQSTKAMLDTAETAVQAFQRQYTARTAAYAQSEQRLKATPEVIGDLISLDQQMTVLRTQRSQTLARISTRAAAKSKLDAEVSRCVRMDQDDKAAIQCLVNLGITEEEATMTEMDDKLQAELRQLEQQRDIMSQLDTELARLDGTVTELSNAMVALDKTVATLEFKRGTQQQLRDAVNTLNQVRDWFHYSNGPHTLSTSVLGIMNQEVNRFLEQFTAPFTVEPSDESLGFRCLFTDGRAMPPDGPPDASMLSGGQKIQLAVAFRFAAYCMFASKLGLLSLDEPTCYLDDANVGRFCDLLQRVKQVAQGMNLQVFIATHERAVMPFVDTVINLTQDTVTRD